MYKILILVILFFLASCQVLQEKLSPYSPDIAYKAADLKGVDMAGLDIEFLFNAKNKAPIPIKFSSIDSDILVDGQKLFKAKVPQGLELKANGDTDFKVAQRIEFKDITKDLLQLFKKDSLNISVDGLANVDLGKFGNTNVPIKANKEVPVPKPPVMKYESFKFVKNEFNLFDPKAICELKFKVSNPNKFPALINFINYGFSADGTKLADGKSPELKLNAGEEKSYSIPVTVSGKSGLDLIPKLTDMSNLKYLFEGTMNLNVGNTAPINLPFQLP